MNLFAYAIDMNKKPISGIPEGVFLQVLWRSLQVRCLEGRKD